MHLDLFDYIKRFHNGSVASGDSPIQFDTTRSL